MAKQRKAKSIVEVITAVAAAMRLESLPNPTDEQKQQIHDAKCLAADVLEDSNYVTAGDMMDETIGQMHDSDDRIEAENAYRQALDNADEVHRETVETAKNARNNILNPAQETEETEAEGPEAPEISE